VRKHTQAKALWLFGRLY